MKIVLATQNPGKLKELNELAGEQNELQFILAPDNFDAIEDGSTYLENAAIKARVAAAMTGDYAIADDSGIEVDALDGRPGIHSARYCEGDDRDRRIKLLSELEGVPPGKRGAAFVSVIALCSPSGEILHSTIGRWSGSITFAEKGSNGFGYDPIFLLPDKGQTSAEISAAEKNRLSHRGQAFVAMLSYIRKNLLKDTSAYIGSAGTSES
jgi:XTP/dITP diphosphohydrolase